MPTKIPRERVEFLESHLGLRAARAFAATLYWAIMPLSTVAMLVMGYTCVWLAGRGQVLDAGALGLLAFGPLSLGMALWMWRVRSRMPHPRELYARR